MDRIVSAIALLGFAFLVARRFPGHRLLIVVAVTLALIVLIVGAEQAGLWPEAARLR